MPGSASEKRKRTFIFVGTCFLTASAILVIVLSNMSFNSFLLCLKEITNSGDHTTLFSFLYRPAAVLKSLIRILGLGAISFFIWFFLKKRCHEKETILGVYLIMITLVILILNLSGFRPSGPVGLLERYIGIVLFIVLFKNCPLFKPVLFTMYLPGLFVFLGALTGSNLSLNENALYLELSIISVILLYSENAVLKNDVSSRFALISSAVFVFGVIFSSGYFVRINSTGPANITDCNAEIKTGPLKGIHMPAEQASALTEKSEYISHLPEQNQLFMILSKDQILCMLYKGETTAASYSSTAVYDSQWIDYYTLFDHPLPDQILLDSQYTETPEQFFATEFGSFLQNNYQILPINDSDLFFRIVRITLSE